MKNVFILVQYDSFRSSSRIKEVNKLFTLQLALLSRHIKGYDIKIKLYQKITYNKENDLWLVDFDILDIPPDTELYIFTFNEKSLKIDSIPKYAKAYIYNPHKEDRNLLTNDFLIFLHHTGICPISISGPYSIERLNNVGNMLYTLRNPLPDEDNYRNPNNMKTLMFYTYLEIKVLPDDDNRKRKLLDYLSTPIEEAEEDTTLDNYLDNIKKYLEIEFDSHKLLECFKELDGIQMSFKNKTSIKVLMEVFNMLLMIDDKLPTLPIIDYTNIDVSYSNQLVLTGALIAVLPQYHKAKTIVLKLRDMNICATNLKDNCEVIEILKPHVENWYCSDLYITQV